ncbi:hypothetical protein O0I10_009136 [Lichtheimia ornata]|uniref:Uncharacterized protein n=1 Tax=Lichtheimia ornata TaxID=688661 RepID=A0AAD7XW79_9FUNG|nr:uncharacterized protein O0I10_009136 [Lichtheimia ornata]KAJ8655268.1 hypothetical protein O0I10_009136 [Lichtheimia ornata]
MVIRARKTMDIDLPMEKDTINIGLNTMISDEMHMIGHLLFGLKLQSWHASMSQCSARQPGILKQRHILESGITNPLKKHLKDVHGPDMQLLCSADGCGKRFKDQTT